jgi:hypothetical protein
MYIKQNIAVNPNEPEQVLVVVQNVDGSGSFTTGMGVTLVQTGTSADGMQAVKNTAALIQGFAGVAAQNIPINGWGSLVAWGFAGSVMISSVGTSITVNAGNMLLPGAVAGTWFSSITPQAASTLLYRYITSIDTITVSTTAWVRGLVKAL